MVKINGASILVYMILFFLMDMMPLKSMAIYAGMQVCWTIILLMLTIPAALMVHENTIRRCCPKCKRKRKSAPGMAYEGG